jgi:hypothetical protein
MAIQRKGSSKKGYIVVLLLVILIGASAAIVYTIQNGSATKAVPGVKVGDTFTYSLLGTSNSVDPNAVTPDYFYEYNDTEYYKVAITAINGSKVSLDTSWRFKNGTEIDSEQTIDLTTGVLTNTHGFGFIYASNLKVGDLIRPGGTDKFTVNLTDTKTYADSTRENNYYAIQNTFYDPNDPTHSTYFDSYYSVYIDKQTGMLESLSNLQAFSNPKMTLLVTQQLTNSTVWKVE